MDFWLFCKIFSIMFIGEEETQSHAGKELDVALNIKTANAIFLILLRRLCDDGR